MVIDTATIIACAALLLLSITMPLINIFFRKPRLDNGSDKETTPEMPPMPKLSVVITADNNAPELRKNLPAILSQDYPEGFEVIVVVEKKEDDTEEVLKSFRQYNLYSTFVPDSSRYMSRKKLAVTIGVKAAKHNWIVLTDAGCRPDTKQWLKTMARNCHGSTNLVMGYSNYDGKSRQYQRFERLHEEMYLMREAQRGTAYRTAGNNLMFRKDNFMNGRGYEGNLKYLRGEYDFIVNKYAAPGQTATELSPDAWVTECAPYYRVWLNKHLYYMETRKHLSRSLSHRIPYFFDKLAMHANYLAIIAAATVSVFTSRWIIACAAAIALIITIALRTIIGKKPLHHFRTEIPAWKTVPFEIGMTLKTIYYRLKYKMADKYDFICHKI